MAPLARQAVQNEALDVSRREATQRFANSPHHPTPELPMMPIGMEQDCLNLPPVDLVKKTHAFYIEEVLQYYPYLTQPLSRKARKPSNLHLKAAIGDTFTYRSSADGWVTGVKEGRKAAAAPRHPSVDGATTTHIGPMVDHETTGPCVSDRRKPQETGQVIHCQALAKHGRSVLCDVL